MDKRQILNYKKYIFVIPLLIFILITYLVVSNKIVPVDTFIYSTTNYIRGDLMDSFFKTITYFGDYLIIILIGILLIIKNRRIGLIILGSTGIMTLFNRIIKYIIRRPRPSVLHVTEETGFSFPSAHTMAACTIYGLIIVYLYNSKLKHKKLYICLLALLVIVVGYSRIYLGVHYFSDVFASIMLTTSVILFLKEYIIKDETLF